MEIKKTIIDGCYIIERNFFNDERGYFSRAMCSRTLRKYGMNANFVQSNLSQNHKKYTLRGLHSQTAPYAEDKLVMCTRGRLLDVCVDVVPTSPTYKKYVSAELSEKNGNCLYIPAGCAHGFLTLEDDTQVLYFMTSEYAPDGEMCYRYDDPAFAINWGISEDMLIISPKDKSYKFIQKN